MKAPRISMITIKKIISVGCFSGLALLSTDCPAAPDTATQTSGATQTAATLFSEAGTDIIPFEDRSRRKWDNAAVADLNLDGHMDLLLTEHSLHAIVYWNDGGTFSGPVIVMPGDTHGVTAGDYDQDGLMDLIISSGGGGGENPRNPMAFHVSKRSIEGGEEITYFERTRGRAAKLVDFDGDGRLDLVLSALPLKTQPEGCNQLFRNVGDGKFEVVGKLPQAKWLGFRTLITDFNNNGIPDVIFYGGDNMVAVRIGKDMTYADASKEVLGELANTSFVTSLAEIDFDNDGDFDLVVTRADFPFGEKTNYDPENSRFSFFARGLKSPFQYDLKIDGDFKLENLQMAWPDFDVLVGANKRKLEFDVDRHGQKDFVLKPEESEGWPSDLSGNGLYIGYLGDGMWRVNVKTATATAGVIHHVKSHPPLTQPKDLPARLFENRDGVFVDVTEKMGISVPEQTAGAAVGDFDNDGWSDIFIVRDGNPTMQTEQILYLNQGGKSFARSDNHGIVSKELGATGCGAEVVDYDEDGKLDLIYSNEYGRWHLFHNNGLPTGPHNFVVVKVGWSPSRKATAQGAVLTINAGGNIYKRVVGATSAAYSQPANTHLHVGLGASDKVDKATVRWTNGETETLRVDDINRSVTAGSFE